MPLRFDEDASPDWLESNRANWEERFAIHRDAYSYDMASHFAGRGHMLAIEEQELGSVDGLKILHLQCRFGRDSFALAQRGAHVTGIDFDRQSIAHAEELAQQLGLSDQTSFIAGDVLGARELLDAPASFDRVYVTWGTICWLRDIKTWAQVVAHFLKPGGWLYFADHHPVVNTFDDEYAEAPGLPTWFWPYFTDKPLIDDAPGDYTGDFPKLKSGNLHEWRHTLGDLVTALLDAGLNIKMLHEHDALPWAAYECLVLGDDRLCRWPDKPWLPLAISIKAEKS